MTASVTCDDLVFLTTDEGDRAADREQGWHLELLGANWEMTSAEQAINAIQSQLFDGEAITAGSYGSLPATLPVAVVGVDSARLAQGSAALIRTLRRPGMRELTYIAPDGASPPTVFDVLHSKPVLQFSDLDEGEARRVYELSLICKPFPRSSTEVVTAGSQIAAPDFTLVDDLASAAAWSAQNSTFPSDAAASSWSPSRHNFVRNGLVKGDGAAISGWTRGAGSNVFRAAGETAATNAAVWSGNPVNSSTRLYANSPICPITGSSALRIRLMMMSDYSDAIFGILYRWYGTSGARISDHTISEVAGGAARTVRTVSAMATPPAGAVSVSIHPYARFTGGSDSGPRNAYAWEAFIGNDGTPFWGNTADVPPTKVFDYTEGGYAAPAVELLPAILAATPGEVSVTAYARLESGFAPVLVRTGSIATSESTPLLAITGVATGGPAKIQLFGVPGRGWINPAGGSTSASGAFKLYFRVGGADLDRISIRQVAGSATYVMASLSITRVELATALPPIGTGRQGKFSLPVEGTMPAEASLQVANEGGVGGNVLIYTSPENPNFVPALSPSLVASGATDAATISNKKFTVPTSMAATDTWQVPHLGLVPSTYALFAKMNGSGLTSGTAYTFSTRHQSSPGSGAPWGENATVTGKIVAPGTGYSGIAQIGVLRLPIVETNDRPGAFEGLRLWVSGGAWVMDEAWLFDLVNGQISYIRPFSTNYPNITIKAASPDSPQQQYYTDDGDGAIRSQNLRIDIWGNHRLDPATGCDVFAICDAPTPDMSVSASYFPRWDMFAAPLSDDGTT